MAKNKKNAYDAAVGLLARREHSCHELTVKLRRKGYSAPDVEQALVECQRLGFQSDARFTAAYLRHRATQGYGPQRIRQELAERGLSEALIASVEQEEAIDWLEIACRVWQKKSAGARSEDSKIRQKIKRFLFYRGFHTQHIQEAEQQLDANDFV